MNRRFILTAFDIIVIAVFVVFTLQKQSVASTGNPPQPGRVLLINNVEQKQNVPSTGNQPQNCLECHRSPNINTNEGSVISQTFCLSCHADEKQSIKTVGKKAVSLKINPTGFNGNPHQFIACIQCHTDVARSPHKTDTGAQCLNCHPVHGEKIAHAPHLQVECQACHNRSAPVHMEPGTHYVKLAHMNDKNQPIGITDHRLNDFTDLSACQKCHKPGNQIGASASILPPKSLLCIVCHPSPAAIGHPIFWIALAFLVFGTLLMVRFWFVGSVQGEETSLHRKISLSSEAIWQTIFSRKLFGLIKILMLDIILQRRILKENIQRWSIHSLIFLAILIRFGFSIFTGLLFSINPNGELALTLIDKNNAFTAFTYDLLGIFIFLGIVWDVIQRFYIRPAHVVTEIEDNITLGIIGLLIILGFLTTGARILLTQVPPDIAVYSFVGYPMSRLLSLLPLDWRLTYPYLWYAHAVMASIFVAYLPFGKLKHIFNVPLTYFLEEVDGVKRERPF